MIDAQQDRAGDGAGWQASYVDDVDAIAAFLAPDALTVAGRRVAVVDSGDGILALGLVTRLGAQRVDAFDDAGCETSALAAWAGRHAGLDELPAGACFHQTNPYELSGRTGDYDLAIWWGDIGTRRDPVRMFGEVRRLLTAGAHVLLRVPPSGSIGADEIQHALLAMGLVPTRIQPPAAATRLGVEDRAESISRLATRGALMLAYRPG